ncbi:DUF2634 domain-containing protein [Paenibacillus eucommiae]|uniref:Phage baseplate assembly protein W n=1 Tax=Paenibacillus eucommiae TaxID=1355755 RepID=A0ABS4IRK1_9BACL|nr:DUF2634 domain-containing protein [Paenibacillus eucommiae]MBP1990204.1 phage baseplate assembly protein W [Paenibacillus eucommiae]
MIPQGGISGDAQDLELAQQSSRTYRINPLTKRVGGMIDGLEAVKQAVYKILQTERYAHIIYSTDYGSQLSTAPGTSPAYVQMELGRKIRDALIQDDRITDVQDMQIRINGDEALASFIVNSEYGNFQVTEEVS